MESADGSFTVEHPADWESVDVGGANVPLAAQGPVSTDQVVISSVEQPGGAEEQALFTAVGLTKQTGRECERTEVEGALVLDCPFDEKGTQYRKLIFPVEAAQLAGLAGLGLIPVFWMCSRLIGCLGHGRLASG